MSEPEIQKADPSARRKALIIMLVGAMVGVPLSLNVEGWLKTNSELILSHPLILCATLALPLLVGAGWSWLLGCRIVASKKWPPPGMKVIKDTRVEIGDRAVRRGTAIRVLAGVLFAGACGMAIMIWLLVESVAKPTGASSVSESAVLDDASK